MSSSMVARPDIAAALKSSESSLRERTAVLTALADATREMLARLERDASADIHDLLALRDVKGREYAQMCARQPLSDDAMAGHAETAATSGDRESAALGMSLLSMLARARDLAKEIMTCQTQCETILRARLQATAKALRQSAQRRKLDAAYGPAHRHDVPVFMDHKK